MKIIYIGSSTPLSLIPLQALINSRHNICALAFDDDLNSDFNVISSGSIQSLALTNSIPLIKFNEKHTNVVSQIQSYQPDVILVSCYSRRLPVLILSSANKGGINIHPSLLPHFRGPSPLFWQFRQGVNNFGITLHHMTEEFDAGNIISQIAIKLQDGLDITQATKILAKEASDLMLITLDNIQNNQISVIKQNNQVAGYQSFPTTEDYSVSTLWTAKRIYNFISAYKGKGISFSCEVKGENFKLINAYSYQKEPYNNMNGKTVVLVGKMITLACKDSYIQCEVEN